MPSPKYVKKDYAIIRDDNTYVNYTLSNQDYEKLEIALMNGNPYVKVAIGMIGLKDVRAVIEQKPEDKSKKEVVKENPAGTPDVDVMTFEYLKQQEKQVKEWLEANPEYMDDEDSELDGGRFN
jgi:hypothetical protein